ncbi:TPA: hypothetical protein EYP13_03565 [Candidatus Micrarchaeota archaeon]|nr:hypothetical protein [Candidatus Micrarchaeota archaeon]
MRGIQLTLKSLLTVLFLAAAVYLWSIDMWNYVPKTTPADYGMIGQMILSLDKVDLIDGSQAGLPWSGETWLVWLSVNPQEAESVVARLGYLEDVIPKEELADDGKQAQYDVKIRVKPIKQQCIYGPDESTMVYSAPLKVLYKEFDAGAGVVCPHANDWWEVFVEPELERLRSLYGDASAVCARVTDGGIPICRAYVMCVFGVSTVDPGRVGYAKLSLKSIYTRDKVTVSAGAKSASAEVSDEGYIGSVDVSKVLYYGSRPIGRIEFTGYLQAPRFCPTPNHVVFNNGQGWKLIPETQWEQFYTTWRQLDTGTLSMGACSGVGTGVIASCRDYLQAIADMLNGHLDSFNRTSPWIGNKPAARPDSPNYAAAYFFAVTPDRPVVYSTYRMYLKASWVGILVSTARPHITSVTPRTVTITGPETKNVTVVVENRGDEGGISVKVRCSNNFLVDGQQESSRSDTLAKGATRSFTYSISYGGSGDREASGTCTVTAVSTANPNIRDTATFTVQFTPKGVYPPNTTVCISRTTYARTDSHGNLIPGTEQRCPEDHYCEDTPSGAKCVKEVTPEPDRGSTPGQQSGETNWVLVGIIAAALVITLLIAIIV